VVAKVSIRVRHQHGREELALPLRLQEVLGELVGSAKGALALTASVVLAELVEEGVANVGRPAGQA
jgi:hypothetical protein